jgi:hypothetical protein
MPANDMPWPAVEALGPPPADPRFVLEPLGPEHNERDHVAWMSSIDHIRATPGFRASDGDKGGWPVAMTLDQNMDDLQMHAAEFANGEAYAYSVIDPASNDVIGCLYVDPDPEAASTDGAQAMVKSWVRADRAELDEPLAAAVAAWLGGSGAFQAVRWPGRPALTS